MKPIKVWPFEFAPDEYRKLSTNGGDEDWIAFVPNELTKSRELDYISWIDGTGFDTCSEPQKIKVNGGIIYIGSHA